MYNNFEKLQVVHVKENAYPEEWGPWYRPQSPERLLSNVVPRWGPHDDTDLNLNHFDDVFNNFASFRFHGTMNHCGIIKIFDDCTVRLGRTVNAVKFDDTLR